MTGMILPPPQAAFSLVTSKKVVCQRVGRYRKGAFGSAALASWN